jgi:hypothetical protein
MKKESFEFTNARNHKLHATAYLPDGAPKAILIWHHGVAEHSGRYMPGAMAGPASHVDTLRWPPDASRIK